MPTILVAESKNPERELLVAILHGRGFRAIAAADAGSVQDVLDSDWIDLMILDLDMPDGAGFSLLDRVCAGVEYIPVIVVVDRTNESALETGLARGAQDCILRPLDPALLSLILPHKINALIRYKDALEEARRLKREFEAKIKSYVSQGTWDALNHVPLDAMPQETTRREITVMFIDIMDFTTLAEREPPTRVIFFLNSIFKYFSETVMSFDGDIDKYIGDAIMVTFQDPNQAVAAAKKILLDVLPSFNELHTEAFPEFLITIGINTGPAVEGDVGGLMRRERTFIGDAVNVASRLQERAAPNSILISGATWEKITDREGFVKMKPVRLKGKMDRIPIYQLLNPVDEREILGEQNIDDLRRAPLET